MIKIIINSIFKSRILPVAVLLIKLYRFLGGLILIHTKYLVVGINAAGFYALEVLRRNDPQGSITAVNGEEFLPYKRTKINKHFNKGSLGIEKFYLQESSWYDKNRITLINNVRVTTINPDIKIAELSNGETVNWEKLLLSPGADNYRPESDVFKKALSIRSYSDSLLVEKHIKTSKSALVYGLGVEGIETAAQLRAAGLKVTLAGRGSHLLRRYFTGQISELVEKLLIEKNISILYHTEIGNIIFSSDKFKVLSANQSGYDFLLYSTGIRPRTTLAESGGLKTDRGIVVNSRMETSLPDIYAAGDCTRIESGTFTDHWHAAQDQGRTAAENMTGTFLEWPRKKNRKNVDIFGKFFFSMLPFADEMSQGMEVRKSILPTGEYRIFYYKNGKLQGVEMTDDKSRAKLYTEAVNKGWSMDMIDEKLGGKV
ncbi:MAG: NAD(P)/FAD-dependent oxidoreductase [Spirochaetales bacterium]|nr:NAD(P)/FAD-dependent oxidoreductase [Spirochaetales bacterium]